jgi:hypothetical protein
MVDRAHPAKNEDNIMSGHIMNIQAAIPSIASGKLFDAMYPKRFG